jgi:hypothetical protein
MHLPLSVVQEVVQLPCSRCERTNGINGALVIRFHIFSKGGGCTSEPVCTVCMETESGIEQKVELEEPDVEVNKRKGLKRQKKVSQQQEIDIAEELGARVQPNSGASVGAKGDVRKKGVARVEAKFTTAKSYSLQHEELQKIAGECGDKEKPILVVDFQDPLTHRLKDRYAILPFEDLKELLDAHHHH